MKMNGQIVKELEKEFLIVKIDFYNNGEDIEYFLFRKSEVTEEKIAQVYKEYNEEYNADKFKGEFYDYLEEKGINYDLLTCPELKYREIIK
ncbi:hypothetical protein CON36_34725 [Bacillus cereus]|uniref:Uncharacterized protein n=2 Tax=Bacillus cereus group TaxID=86661 RepID=A0A9X6XV46_BACCE|nr:MULTISPECIES: hypothetical protein [Bacillus cereus group]PDZ94264.1 hypothetical protein CON36_34725 [Bacillus cereus]PFJ38849.1 hypothetical protein COJ15_17385 [Bacillus thuringiensis]